MHRCTHDILGMQFVPNCTRQPVFDVDAYPSSFPFDRSPSWLVDYRFHRNFLLPMLFFFAPLTMILETVYPAGLVRSLENASLESHTESRKIFYALPVVTTPGERWRIFLRNGRLHADIYPINFNPPRWATASARCTQSCRPPFADVADKKTGIGGEDFSRLDETNDDRSGLL